MGGTGTCTPCYDHPPMHLPASEGLKATVDSIANVTAAETAIGDIAGTCPPLESVVDKAAYENNCRKLAKVLHGNEFTTQSTVWFPQ